MTVIMTVEAVLMSNIPARVESSPVSSVGPRVFAVPTTCLGVKRMAICTLQMHVFSILARKPTLLCWWCLSALPTVALQPQFPPPSVIKIPMESVQSDPQNSIHCIQFSSDSHSVVSDSWRPHESQHARPPCLSPTPGIHSDSCASTW